MNNPKKLVRPLFALASALVLVSTSAHGAPQPTTAPSSTVATEYFKCKMADNADFDQIVAAGEAMLADAKAHGLDDYKLNIFIPLYDNDTSFGVFYWVGSSPNATRLGAYNDFWKDGANEANRVRFASLIKECDRAGVYWNRELFPSK
jgi:hypothetical protein